MQASYSPTNMPELMTVNGDTEHVRFGVSIDYGRTWGSIYSQTNIDHSLAKANHIMTNFYRTATTPVHDGTDWFIMVAGSTTSYFYKVTTRAMNFQKVGIS
jgi:hypothetical protein